MTKSTSLTVFILFFLVMSCGSKGQTPGKMVDAEELKRLIQGDVVLIDVRTPGEYERGRITGAKLINYRDVDFAEQLSRLDKDKPVAVYCAAGGRSTGAMKIMEQLGFETVYNYTGGFSDWQKRGEAIEK